MSNKSRGLNFEREIVQIFRKAGFGALRSAGSHSPFDVVIWKEAKGHNGTKRIAHVCFVQCKTKKPKKKNE